MTQAAWYIDPINGNDDAAGSAGHPIKTGLEYTRRTGIARVLTRQVDIFLLNSMPVTDCLFFSARIATEAAGLHLHGVPSLLHTGTLTGVTNYLQASGQGDELEDGILDWTPFVGKMVEILSIAARCFVLKALGPGRARVGWIAVRDPTDVYNVDTAVATMGMAYRILELPTIANFVEDIQGVQPADISRTAASVELVTLASGQPPGQFFASLLSPLVVYYDSILPSVETVNTTLCNCLFSGFGYLESGTTGMTLCSALDASLLVEGLVTGFGMILQASQIVIPTSTGYYEAHHDGTGLGIFDSDTPILVQNGGTLAVAAPIWGAGITTSIVELDAGSKMTLDSAYTVKLLASTSGGPSDVLLNGKTAVPAIDPVTFAPTAARTLTFVNLITPVASGGFQGNAFDPRSPATSISAP